MKPSGFLSLLFFAGMQSIGFAASPLSAFSTGGHVVYHLRPATVAPGGKRAIVSAALDGAVLCHTFDGTLMWRGDTGGAFPFDLAVGDTDGDGFDESFVACGDGALYAFDHDGKRLWTFGKEPPLYQVCIVRSVSGAPIILTGGIEKILYALAPDGRVLQQRPTEFLIRDIRAGNFRGDGKEYAAVVTCQNGRDSFYMQLFDAASLAPVWDKEIDLTRTVKAAERVRVFSVISFELGHDGKDEIVMSLTTGRSADLAAFDGDGKRVQLSPCEDKAKGPYRMNLLAPVKGPSIKDDFILGLFGVELIAYNRDGTARESHVAQGALANIAFDPQTNTCLLGSDVSGDDGVTLLDLSQPGWGQAFESLKPVGRLAQVHKNLATLADQARRFTPPAYQPAPRPALVVVQQKPEEVEAAYKKDGRYSQLTFASYISYTEQYESGITEPKWREEFERRHSGKTTPKDEIIAEARQMEAAGQDFVVWAGHGRIWGIDFYISLQTIEALLKAAPKTLRGFVFAELEGMAPQTKTAVLEQLVPMAEMCRKHGGKKILLRNKNIFWNGNCYHDAWRGTLLSGNYADIFVPSMEETNCRVQELSLAGRMGLWMAGKFTNLSARAVTDNATYNRCWEWSQQQTLSHFLRSLAYQCALGANILHINAYGGSYDSLVPLYDLLDKGALWIPSREEVLSLSEVCLAMDQPSESYLDHGSNGHGESGYAPVATPAVFERLDCYWGGAPIPAHDFTYYACGSRNRMLNFLPPSPYGLVCMIPADTDPARFPFAKRKIATDGEFFFDDKGAKRAAPEYQPVVEQALKDAAARLAVRVEGRVAWTAARIDATHIRVTLLDSGYVDPAERDAVIVAQRVRPVTCRDILAGEDLAIRDGRIALQVPAGALRIVDIEHQASAAQ